MITPTKEYAGAAAQIQLGLVAENYFPLPAAERIYKIDLNTRLVEAPDLLSVTADNESEILFFEVDRYYDNMDLLNTACVITYTNAAKESFIYPLPSVDTVSKRDENKLILPWVISSDVTWKAGKIIFGFQFYIINTETLSYDYMLNTIPAYTRVAQGIDFKYIEANDLAKKDKTDWANKRLNYFIKRELITGTYRYEHPKIDEPYSESETYYIRAEEARISDGTKLEAIYQQLDQLKKNALKWVEI